MKIDDLTSNSLVDSLLIGLPATTGRVSVIMPDGETWQVAEFLSSREEDPIKRQYGEYCVTLVSNSGKEVVTTYRREGMRIKNTRITSDSH